MKPIERIAPDVGWLPLSFVNVYFVGKPGGPWILVDAGIPGRAAQIAAAAEARFGSGSRPEAIVLTHGHADHAGSALALAEQWDVPIFAHHLEFPYLTRRSAYPTPDPTVGGAIAFLSRFLPSKGPDLSGRLRALREGEVPGMQDWEWHATPGHAPGHVSFFRPADRVLLAGDAFATMNMDSWIGFLTKRKELARGGAPFNYDWSATRKSVSLLADLRPNVVGCGHGVPMQDGHLPARLRRFADRFWPPDDGRYVRQPAMVDDKGIVSLPPPPFDPLPLVAAGVALVAGIAIGAGFLERDSD